MNNKEILDNAPPSATHVDIHNHYWRIEDGDYWMIRVNIRWEYKRVDNSIRSLADIKRIAELEEIVKAVAHIGVDFGYGKYELEAGKIDDARTLMEQE